MRSSYLARFLPGMLLLLAPQTGHAVFTPGWSPNFTAHGPTGTVDVLRSAGGSLYAAGYSDSFGPYAYPGVMRWDGTAWAPVGTGLKGFIYGMAISQSGKVCVAGDVWSPTGNAHYGLAIWDGAAWTFPAGTAKRHGAGPIATVGDTVYLVFGEDGREILRWDGTALTPLSMAGGEINALETLGSDLIVGGDFYGIGPLPDTNIAAYSGGRWKSLGGSLPFTVNALAVADGQLWAGGGTIPGKGADPERLSLMRWNGQTWSEQPISFGPGSASGGPGSVSALAGAPGHVYAAGSFADGKYPLAEWDGTRWRAYGAWLSNASIPALAAFGGDLWVGGRLSNPVVYGLARFRDTIPLDPAPGIASLAPAGRAALLVSNGRRLFAYGSFGSPVSDSLRLTAEWTGAGWTYPGRGIPDSGQRIAVIYAASMREDTVFAAYGYRGSHDGARPHAILRGDGAETWDTLGHPDGDARVLCPTPEGLYIAGDFTHIDGAPIAGLALWQGGSWHAAGGPERPVSALAWDGTALVAADHDTSLFNSRVWRRQGGTWSRLGADTGASFDGMVGQLARIGGRLWASGGFRHAGSEPVRGVAAWDGTAWKQVGHEIDSNVNGLAVGPQGEVYAVGEFTTPGPAAARWNGTAWEAMGKGLGVEGISGPSPWYPVWCDEGLFVAGYFTYAGGNPSPWIARWTTRPEVLAAASRRPGKRAKGTWRLFPDGGFRLPYPGREGSAADAAGRARGNAPAPGRPSR